MRFYVFATALLVAATARADRLIDIPTASPLTYGSFRLEYADSTSDGRTQLGYFDAGVGTSFETTIRAEQYEDRSLAGTFDLTYNYLSPISGLAPGFAAGCQDVLGNSIDGRRFFGCVTFRDVVEGIGGEFPYDLTLGWYFGSHTSPFLGLRLPFSSNFTLLAEHDGIRLSAGVEYHATKAFALKLLARGPDMLADLSWQAHF